MSVERTEALPKPIVIKLASVLKLEDGAFIVGGQAVNLWAERYAPNCPELAYYAPFTSKDLDYFGYAAAAQKLAEALGGEAIYPDLNDHTPQSALVCATVDGRALQIDFLSHVIGIQPIELQSQAVELRVPLNNGEGYLDIPVMHPLHCLQSKVTNYVKLDRKDDAAMRQLGAAPIILEKYIKEMLQISEIREVVRTIQRLYYFLHKHEAGRLTSTMPMPDPLGIITRLISDNRLDWRFRWFNLRQMRKRIRESRSNRASKS